MIKPTKYMDLDNSVLMVAAVILSELRKHTAVPLQELDERVGVKLSDDARFNFSTALSFLYLTGKLDYDLESDAVVSFVKPHSRTTYLS